MFSTTELIEADVSTVWRHLTVPELMGRWMRSVSGHRTRDGAPLEHRSELIFYARGRERSSEVISFEENRIFTLRSVQGSFTAVYSYELHPASGTTSATLQVECGATGLSRVIAPIIRQLMWLTDGGQLKLLKRAVESAALG